jgi:hypothetical protein
MVLAEAVAGMASGANAASVKVSTPERSRRALRLVLGNMVILSSLVPGNVLYAGR